MKKYKKAAEPQIFWTQVQKQFDSPDFMNVVRVRDAMEFNQELSFSLIPFLTQQICITDDLDVKTRFDLLSENSKFNFISLICISKNFAKEQVPNVLLSDPFIKSIYDSYTEKPPKLSFSLKDTNKDPQSDNPPPPMQSEPFTKEFYDELDSILVNYPNYAESYLQQNLTVNSFQLFYNFTTGFYSQQRSFEGSAFVIRFIIKPYVKSLEISANRLISDALQIISRSVSEILIDEMIQPIIFDPSSKVYQFELIQRLFCEQTICQNTLSRLFVSRPPSLEPKLEKGALNLICTAIQKSPQLSDDTQKLVLLHIRNQIEHFQSDDSSRLLIFFFKWQDIKNEQTRQMALDSISLIPENVKQIALQLLNKKT